MSLLETMSFGMVPVVTDVGSISSVVINKVNGLFIEVKNTESLVTTIKKISAGKISMETLSKNARNTILSQFDDRYYFDQLNRCYEE